MSLLSDQGILKAMRQRDVVLNPFSETDLQPASVDVHLGVTLRETDHNTSIIIDPRQDQRHLWHQHDLEKNATLTLKSGDFVLAHVHEYLTLSNRVACRIEGRSSLARYGLIVHSTAGFVDPGWSGNLTLEIANLGSFDFLLVGGMKIAHLSFHRMQSPAHRPYGHPELSSKYKHQTSPGTSRSYKDFGV